MMEYPPLRELHKQVAWHLPIQFGVSHELSNSLQLKDSIIVLNKRPDHFKKSHIRPAEKFSAAPDPAMLSHEAGYSMHNHFIQKFNLSLSSAIYSARATLIFSVLFL
jgi:hypothetical protein